MSLMPSEDEARAIQENWSKLYHKRKKKKLVKGFHIIPGINAFGTYDEEEAQKEGPTFLTYDDDDSYRPTRKSSRKAK
jgi:hypothetical protein